MTIEANRLGFVQTPQFEWNDPATVSALTKRLHERLKTHQRVMIGIVGAPGAGKSTLADALVQAWEADLPGQVVCVPMDGFHLAHSLIEKRGQVEIKGAPLTFDADGYLATLSRLRNHIDETIYAPQFHREISNPIAAEIPVTAQARVIVTEGNYLLLDAAPWNRIRTLLDEIWLVTLPDSVRIARLTERHMRYQDTYDQAKRRATGSDQRNAELVGEYTEGASVVIHND